MNFPRLEFDEDVKISLYAQIVRLFHANKFVFSYFSVLARSSNNTHGIHIAHIHGKVLPLRNTVSKNTELRPIVSSVGPIVQKQLDI